MKWDDLPSGNFSTLLPRNSRYRAFVEKAPFGWWVFLGDCIKPGFSWDWRWSLGRAKKRGEVMLRSHVGEDLEYE